MNKIKQKLFSLAVRYVTDTIKKDSDLHYAYQANIAMAFYDEYYKMEKCYKNREDLHGISNRAAISFLKLWSYR